MKWSFSRIALTDEPIKELYDMNFIVSIQIFRISNEKFKNTKTQIGFNGARNTTQKSRIAKTKITYCTCFFGRQTLTDGASRLVKVTEKKFFFFLSFVFGGIPGSFWALIHCHSAIHMYGWGIEALLIVWEPRGSTAHHWRPQWLRLCPNRIWSWCVCKIACVHVADGVVAKRNQF